LAELAEPRVRGHGQREWYLRLERERDNVRAALRWLLDQDDPAERERALRLAGALGGFWFARGYHAEGRRWLEEALDRAPREGIDATTRTKAQLLAGLLLTYQSEFARSRAVLEEALALAQQRQDTAAIAESLRTLGTSALFAGEVAQAVVLLQDAVERSRKLAEPLRIGFALYYLGTATLTQGDVATAIAQYRESLHYLEAAGAVRLSGFVHLALGMIDRQRGALTSAAQHIQRGLAISTTFQDRWLLSLVAREALAVVGDHIDQTKAVRLLGAADALKHVTGATLNVWERVTTHRAEEALREHLAHGAWEAAYREGISLSVEQITTLIAHVLDVFAQLLEAGPQPEANPEANLEHGPRQQLSSWRGQGSLTEREQEVLQLVAQGLSSKAIAHRLSISTNTVNYHLTGIFNKFGVDRRAQAVAVAVERGLL
jgi:ATP/maltotriose-dependent transcriptional regulator MalT